MRVRKQEQEQEKEHARQGAGGNRGREGGRTGLDQRARRALGARGVERGQPARALHLVRRLQVERLRRARLRNHYHRRVVPVRAHERVRDVDRAATRVRHLVRVPARHTLYMRTAF